MCENRVICFPWGQFLHLSKNVAGNLGRFLSPSPSPTLFFFDSFGLIRVCSHQWLNIVGTNGAQQQKEAERIRSPVAVSWPISSSPLWRKRPTPIAFSPAQISIPCQAPGGLICSSSRIMTPGRGRERQKLTGIKGARDFFFFSFLPWSIKNYNIKVVCRRSQPGSNLSGQGVGSEFIWTK